MIIKIGIVLIALIVVIVGEELFSPERRSKAAEEYREMQKLRKEVGAPILDLPKDDDTKSYPPGGGA